ncbi:MAG: hypothetical protein JXB49_28690 [Bacteroidales bacterium]|nr:hypothetical protein [Bacteroidales bacterium]
MKTFAKYVIQSFAPSLFIAAILFTITVISCKKLDKYNQKPELESLQQGLKTSTAIGYCVSIAEAAHSGKPLPNNVVFDKNSGLIYVKVDAAHPLPFNTNVGDIVMAGLWTSNGGILSILLANINIIEGDVKLYGLHTIPFIKRSEQEGIMAVFADQDIIVGNGSDTILDLSNITSLVFNSEMSRLDKEKPSDPFAIVKQNVWFIDIDQSGTTASVLDDIITINGGGQIVEARSESGGIMYHALIDTKVDFSLCTVNPVSGHGLSQNFKAGTSFIDLGNSFLSFHSGCDGKALVEFSSGKYLGYNGKQISLNLE